MRMAQVLCLLGIVLAAVCSAAPIQDVAQLGEEADSGYTVQYGKDGNPITEVFHAHRAEPGAKWARESAQGHPHCAHCHSACHTENCHEMCSSKYCDSNYAFKPGRAEYLKTSGRVIPSYRDAIVAANAALDKTKTARTEEAMEKAKELVAAAMVQAEVNRQHWENAAKAADNIDRAAYSSKDADTDDRKTYIIEQAVTQDEEAQARAAEEESQKLASQNNAFVSTTDTVAETGGFSKGTSMMAAVAEVNEDETDAEETMEDKPAKMLGASVSSVADVEAEIETAGVKADAAANGI